MEKNIGVVVVVLLTRIAEAALIVDAAHVQACADGGGEHGAHVDAADGRDEFRGVVVGKGGLRLARFAGMTPLEAALFNSATVFFNVSARPSALPATASRKLRMACLTLERPARLRSVRTAV